MGIPMLLLGGAFRTPPSAAARKVVLIIGSVLFAISGVLWLLGLNALPVVLFAYVPAYQMWLLAWASQRFKSRYGREMQLFASGIISDPELKKDAYYSKAYFIGAAGAPLVLLMACVALTAK